LEVTATGSGAEKEDIAVVTQWEWNAAKADEARDVDFYDGGLANDWTDGMSNGEFQYMTTLFGEFRKKTLPKANH
jgi:hypothetical protein